MGRLINTFIILLLTATTISAQQLNPDEFIFPLEGVEQLYSANFGELRPDHFHSGIDIKTDGVEGKRVVSIADGYVSRISVSPYGYGLALYVTHTNGTTSVYGHLSRYRSDIAEFVNRERIRTKQNSANFYCNSKTFPVKQGDLIAYSGNTGSSFGPHLHFEIRETSSQKTINTVAQHVIKPKDTIPPYIVKMHYIEVDSVGGVVYNAPLKSYTASKVAPNKYKLSSDEVPVGRRGYFVAEVTDRRDGVTNTFGVYNLTQSLDGEVIFDYKMDGFTFDRTRYCNAITYYPIKIASRNEVLRLAMLEGGDKSYYRTIKNRGLITTTDGEKRTIEIKATDDCGNSSSMEFTIKGKADSLCYVAQIDSSAHKVFVNRNFQYKSEKFNVTILRNTLYESVEFKGGLSQRTPSSEELAMALSPIYSVFDYNMPLHKYMSVSIDAFVPTELQKKVGLAHVGRSGKPSFLKGKYEFGRVTAESRNAGDFFVVVDTLPPTMKLGFAEGADLTKSKYFSCSLSDDLSGTSSYSATIDGEWIMLDLRGERLYHNFTLPVENKKRKLIITTTDGVGNKTVITQNFIR